MALTDAVRRRSGVSDEARDWAARFLKQHHHGVDVGRLDDNEVSELIELINKVKQDDGVNLTRLSKREHRRYEALAERACGLKPGSFEAERNEQNLRDRAAGIAARAAPTPTPRAERSLLGALGRGLQSGDLDIEDVAALVPVIAALILGEGLAPYSSVADGQLRIDRRYGPAAASRDDLGVLSHWRQSLARLDEAGYLEVETRSGEFGVRLGPKTKAALS